MIHITFLLATCLVLFSGCSNPFGNDGSQIDPGHSPGLFDAYVLPNGRGAEPVATSSQVKETHHRHYGLSGSLANHGSSVERKTSRGYTLYSNVQGQLISGDGSQ